MPCGRVFLHTVSQERSSYYVKSVGLPSQSSHVLPKCSGKGKGWLHIAGVLSASQAPRDTGRVSTGDSGRNYTPMVAWCRPWRGAHELGWVAGVNTKPAHVRPTLQRVPANTHSPGASIFTSRRYIAGAQPPVCGKEQVCRGGEQQQDVREKLLYHEYADSAAYTADEADWMACTLWQNTQAVAAVLASSKSTS